MGRLLPVLDICGLVLSLGLVGGGTVWLLFEGSLKVAIKYLPTNDYAFRSLFGSPHNFEVTAGFLRDFFGEEVKPGHIQLLKNDVVDKVAFAKLDEGAQSKLIETIRDITLEILPAKITIEMQVIREPNFIKRALHYLTRLYVDSYGSDTEAPDKREALKPVWSMNVLAHKRFLNDAEPYRLFALRDEVTAELLEKNPLRLGFFEIPKQLELQAPSGANSLAARRTSWAYFCGTLRRISSWQRVSW